jgi:hypothetical protein
MVIRILYQRKRLKSMVAEKSASNEAQKRTVITGICISQRLQLALSRSIFMMRFARDLVEAHVSVLRHEGARHQS